MTKIFKYLVTSHSKTINITPDDDDTTTKEAKIVQIKRRRRKEDEQHNDNKLATTKCPMALPMQLGQNLSYDPHYITANNIIVGFDKQQNNSVFHKNASMSQCIDNNQRLDGRKINNSNSNFSLSSHPTLASLSLSLAEATTAAVEFDNVTYRRRDDLTILESIYMLVPRGSIFGLLGPSSCGKTTLLRCLVGLLKHQQGNIRIFGHDTHDRAQCKVPGSNVGYMPQDLGLYEDFTIEQLLTMFGRYMAMPSATIEQRIDFMTRFLDLPDKRRVVAQLSGGQKRRVSFALACLNLPPLIMLDEPTVGVDPLLRRSIWQYLSELAHKHGHTIIITTHYIEEAARADQVALMRKGRLLVQDSPQSIMARYACTTLEQAFLQICYEKKKISLPSGANNNTSEIIMSSSINADGNHSSSLHSSSHGIAAVAAAAASAARVSSDKSPLELASCAKSESLTSLIGKIPKEFSQPFPREPIQAPPCPPSKPFAHHHHQVMNNNWRRYDVRAPMALEPRDKSSPGERCIKAWRLLTALMYKNFRRNFNSAPLVAFQFLLPIVQMVSFVLSVGGRPVDIGLGIVNYETLPLSASTNGSLTHNEWLSQQYLSTSFIEQLDTAMLAPRYYRTLDDALADVRRARLWAALEIGQHFSDLVATRFDLDQFYDVNATAISGSTIRLYPDRSNRIIDTLMLRSIVESYRRFMNVEFEEFSRLPVVMGTPIFEIKNTGALIDSIDGYTESIAAGLLASITYIMAAGLTTFIMVVERHAGILERTYTTGVSPVIYLLAHALFRSLVMMAQLILLFFVCFVILGQPLEGSLPLAYALLLLLNCTGVAYGLTISSLTKDQNSAALTVVSSLVIQVTMSGILWPLQAIPVWLRAVCYTQPLTLPVLALKNITLKGLGFDDRYVMLGFGSTLAWMIVFLVIASKNFKFYQ
ncbi:ABC transporter G family member 23 [Fragariocoptes setiger]|uniref:ABC transporter G family member 23 n=1 Tax=Fragariocoptes setiger TaxID=1670756 RepID=A0ABQ7SA73_9ACAR|nr:ABC transporter G family member 23 [Fragariocoptes setiger]